MALDQQSCIPCKGTDVQAMDRKEAEKLLKQIPGWVLDMHAQSIVGEFRFPNFKKALAFVNAIGTVAEEQNHHPDISFGWGYATVTLQTHSIQGLHENDFVLAAKINTLSK